VAAASQQQQQLNEVIDINWHSINVPSSESNSLTVQNLSQDTTYEFYVRAKNIIGEGPRSQVVQATTKRALMGSVTPIDTIGGPETMAASTLAGLGNGKCSCAAAAPGRDRTDGRDHQATARAKPLSSSHSSANQSNTLLAVCPPLSLAVSLSVSRLAPRAPRRRAQHWPAPARRLRADRR
jgi:hypothetical protein